MTTAWYDPTNHHVSTDKNDPLFTPLGQLWPVAVKRPWVDLEPEDRLCAKYMLDAPEGIEAVIDYITAKLKELNT